MNPNETIGKWAVEKGLLDCWHNFNTFEIAEVYGCRDIRKCVKCHGVSASLSPNPNYTIYENIAPVLDKITKAINAMFVRELMVEAMFECQTSGNGLSQLIPTLRDMVAELIDKGEV